MREREREKEKYKRESIFQEKVCIYSLKPKICIKILKVMTFIMLE